jgi:hypothetical protein
MLVLFELLDKDLRRNVLGAQILGWRNSGHCYSSQGEIVKLYLTAFQKKTL